MTRTSTIVTLAILSSVLTPVVVKATSPEASPQAKVEAAAVTTDSAAPSSCGRKVKVVYAGYGEGQGGACATTAELRR
jgi:hypothetical protein